jgi:hypothetical protein
MTLIFRNVFELSQNLIEIIGGWIGYLIFKIEVDAFCCRNRDGVLALILLYELPEGISAELLLETDSHDFILAHLRPLDSVCMPPGVL